MSKRKTKLNSELQTQPKLPKTHWSLGLLETMKDPEYVYKQSGTVVVIKDKYPKAKVHYLILPRDEIRSIFNLNDSHISLLSEFETMYAEIKKEHPHNKLSAGFHAVPSMQCLHMHVISKDMNSPSLKTKVHWNSFTTKFFIPYTEVLKMLKENGCVKKISNEIHKSLMSTPLVCNQCSFVPKNMPKLKEHLLTHCT